MLVEIFCVCLTIFLVFLVYSKLIYSYWDKRNVPCIPGKFPFGSVIDLIRQKQSIGELIRSFYNEAKKNDWPHIGIYFFVKPVYVPVDLNILKHILQSDFEVFTNRGSYYNEKSDPLTAHMFNLEDERWRVLRQKLSPTFTTGQMKNMFHTVVETSKGLKQIMNESCNNGSGMEVKEVAARFTTDVIASTAFGITCNTLKNPDSEFRAKAKEVVSQDWWSFLTIVFTQCFPYELLKFFGMKSFRPSGTKFFKDLVEDTVNYRETNGIHRKDFMHLLIQLKNRGKIVEDGKIVGDKDGSVGLTMNEIAAQAFLFYLAGFETSSTTISFVLYELARHQAVQDRARDEINQVLKRHGGNITYEALVEMKYLQQIIDETLRLYPPVTILERHCKREYKVPGTDVVLEKGTHVHIPVLGIHYDPDLYPQPDIFDPDRFTEDNKKNLPSCSYLPFGDGPRICIGLRFGIMETKVALVTMLQDHKITLNEKTTVPLEFDPTALVFSTKEPIWLNVTKLN